ncbi:MAG: AAA family ATPase [Candidatus Omnitrophota bacterium]
MSYYKLLGMKKEPFSTSPDPEFFYLSAEHKAAFYRLRIAIELKRGLSLVMADVGAGKTTLSRKLFQVLGQEPDVITAMVLNPIYDSQEHFLQDLSERFHIKLHSGNGCAPTSLDYMNAIERFLFRKGVEDGKTVVLLIDEAQKLSDGCLEILRSLLNYETNEYKILQLVLMGQMELLPRMIRIKNLWDRIAVNYVINPLDEADVRELINFRLEMAGYAGNRELFTEQAVSTIFRHSRGYPRRISMLCHDALEYMIMHRKLYVDIEAMDDIIRRNGRAEAVFDIMANTAGAHDGHYLS